MIAYLKGRTRLSHSYVSHKFIFLKKTSIPVKQLSYVTGVLRSQQKFLEEGGSDILSIVLVNWK